MPNSNAGQYPVRSRAGEALSFAFSFVTAAGGSPTVFSDRNNLVEAIVRTGTGTLRVDLKAQYADIIATAQASQTADTEVATITSKTTGLNAANSFVVTTLEDQVTADLTATTINVVGVAYRR